MNATVETVTPVIVDAYGRAAELDAYLGDPADLGGRMPLAVTLERDHDRAFPAEAVAALDAWGLPRHYVPEAFGGGLRDVFELLLLMRTVAARDLTVAVGHGKTVLGAISAWAAADDSATHMARIVGAGEAVSWGLTEKDRGSDLAASQTAAASAGGGIRLDGHKWPIGNATRGRAITVLARTEEDKPGPRALSLVLVDKTEVDPATLSYRARRPLHGIRGADISGIDFAGTVVPGDRRVGAPGQGIEIVLKSLQVTRTLCAALSLGAGDQALACLAASRVDAAVIARGAADLLLAEAVAFAGARLFHVAPAEMALTSAFVKVLVPDLVDGVIRDGSYALGVNVLLEDGPGAAWEKVARDAKVVSIFDGNSVVNLNVVINELPNIARGEEEPCEPGVFAFGRESTPFDMSGLRLVTRRGSRLLRSLPDLVERLDDGRTHPDAVRTARALVAVWRELAVRVGETERAARPPVAQFALAEQVTSVFAGAAAIAVFVANRDHAGGDAWHDDLWLRAALARTMERVGGGVARLPVDPLRRLAEDGAATILPTWRATGRRAA